MTSDNSPTHSITVGDLTVTAIYDSLLEGQLGVVSGVSEAVAEETLTRNFGSVPPLLTVNAFLIRHPGGLALVDAGSGDKMGPGNGKLVAHLAAIGVSPADIGTILITHVHNDHTGGLTGPDGGVIFPNAALVLSRVEMEFSLDESASVPEAHKASKAMGASTLNTYRERLRGIEDGEEGLPGIRLVSLPGHTPGHSGWMVRSGADSLLIWGDIVHLPALQFERPEATVIYDLDPAMAEASRRRAMDMANAERLLVAGMHLDFPGLGHVERRGSGYGFVASTWRA